MTRADGSKCHAGAIEVVILVGDHVLTGGNDGRVAKWDVASLENAEVSS